MFHGGSYSASDGGIVNRQCGFQRSNPSFSRIEEMAPSALEVRFAKWQYATTGTAPWKAILIAVKYSPLLLSRLRA
jgi:hypothetical protein